LMGGWGDAQLHKRTDSGSSPVSVPTGDVDRGSAVGRRKVEADMCSRSGNNRRAPRVSLSHVGKMPLGTSPWLALLQAACRTERRACTSPSRPTVGIHHVVALRPHFHRRCPGLQLRSTHLLLWVAGSCTVFIWGFFLQPRPLLARTLWPGNSVMR
jgi:hypothetical protein